MIHEATWCCEQVRQKYQSVCQSVSQPVSQSVSQPVSQSVSQSTSQSISQSTSQSISQSVNQSVNQSVSQSVNQSVSQPVNQSTSQSFSQSVSQSTSQSVNQSVSQSVNQSTSQPVSQSVSQSVNHSLTCFHFFSTALLPIGDFQIVYTNTSKGKRRAISSLVFKKNTTKLWPGMNKTHPRDSPWCGFQGENCPKPINEISGIFLVLIKSLRRNVLSTKICRNIVLFTVQLRDM